MSVCNIRTFYQFTRVKIVKNQYYEEDNLIVIHLEPDRRYLPVCSICGSNNCMIHSYRKRFVRDLPLATNKVILHYTYRRIICKSCGICNEANEFVSPYARFTKRFAWYIFSLCQYMTIKDVSEHLGIDWKTVKELDKARIRERLECDGQRIAPILAIDEIAIRKGHNYLTVVIDHDQGKVLWMGPDRKMTTLQRFFTSLSEDEISSIKAIATDMWDPYIKAIKTYCPKADIVFDLFHVVQHYNRVIDVVRNHEYRRASQENKSVIKGTKYLLIKNRISLLPEEKPKLNALLTLNQNLSTMYILKDYLKKLWNYKYPAAARNFLNYWYHLAYESGLKPLKQFARMLKRYAYGIINHARFPIHTGKLEGINNKIKVIKHKAYGFLDLEYFILKVKYSTL